MERLAAQKGPAAGGRSSGTADYASEGIRLRSELGRAIEVEDYTAAARLRDELEELQAKTRQQEALAAEWAGSETPRLRLGQRVRHKQRGYQAVVVGWDMRCCESEDWQQQADVASLAAKGDQIFYHLLPHALEVGVVDGRPPCMYVAQELLTCPELDDGEAWASVEGTDPIEHPFLPEFFLGQDGKGDYVPSSQLRRKFNIQRQDVHPPGGSESDSEYDTSSGEEEGGDEGPQAGSGGSRKPSGGKPPGPIIPGIDMSSLE